MKRPLLLAIGIAVTIAMLFISQPLMKVWGVTPIPSEVDDEDILLYIAEITFKQAGIENPNVKYVFTYNTNYNCGITEKSPEGGCYRIVHPDTIYLSPGLKGKEFKYILLHEYAHVEQFRNGQPLDECAADAQAEKWGAEIDTSAYAEKCQPAE